MDVSVAVTVFTLAFTLLVGCYPPLVSSQEYGPSVTRGFIPHTIQVEGTPGTHDTFPSHVLQRISTENDDILLKNENTPEMRGTLTASLPSHAKDHVELPPGSRADFQDNLGQFSHGYSNIDGTTLSEQGRLITTNDGWEAVIVKKGSYSFISPEGQLISVSYIADENGFRVVDEHLLR